MNVEAAVFTWQMTHDETGEKNTTTAYYLVAERADPSLALFLRFARYRPLVWPDSQHRPKNNRPSVWANHSMHLGISSIRWVLEGKAIVHGGLQCGSLCGNEGAFDVSFNKDRWSVVSYKREATF